MDGAPIGRAPVAPLRAIDAAEIAVRARPFVPDGHAVFAQVADIGIAREKPQQLVDDGAEVELLRGEQRKARAKIEARLRAEDRVGAGAGAVGFEASVVEDEAEQIVVGAHERREHGGGARREASGAA